MRGRNYYLMVCVFQGLFYKQGIIEIVAALKQWSVLFTNLRCGLAGQAPLNFMEWMNYYIPCKTKDVINRPCRLTVYVGK